MIVGVDVHKRAHCAALIDERGVVLGTLSFPNSAAGVRKLRAWLATQGAKGAVVGIENGAGYGQLLCNSLAAAGHEVLNVPAWRTKRDRAKHGPGKSDPGDAVAIARVVLTDRAHLGPALEPELVRALAVVETLRRQTVARRTDAIQRLRALWTQFDPEAEMAVGNVLAARTLKRLRQLRLGDGVLGDAATACFHCIVAEVARLDAVVRDLDEQLAGLVTQSGNPLEDVCGAGLQVTATLIAQVGRRAPLPRPRRLRPLRRRGADPLRLGCNGRPAPPAPRRQPPGQRRPAPHRHRPGAVGPRCPGVPGAQARRGQDTTRGATSTQTPPRQPRLSPPSSVGGGHAPGNVLLT